MKIIDLTMLGWRFKFGFELSDTYGVRSNYTWQRAYIKNSEGVQIGRMIFRDGELYSVKCYKPQHCTEVDETDQIFDRLRRFMQDGTFIPLPRYLRLYGEARRWVSEDRARKLAWRGAHPKFGWIKDKETGEKHWGEKRRPRLGGRNPRSVLYEMVMLYPNKKPQRLDDREMACV